MTIELEETIRCFKGMYENIFLQAIIALIFLDIFTGIAKAIKNKKINSSFGLLGFAKHLGFFMMNIFLTYFLQIINLEIWLAPIYFIFYILYLTSIAENCYELNWKLPKFILKNLLKYQESIDEGNLDGVFDCIRKLNNKKIEKEKLTDEENELLKKLVKKAKEDKK